MDNPKPSRRDFCGQAVSFIAVGALLESCGGSPTSPSTNSPALPTIPGSVAGNAITLSIDGGSPLASVGSAALIRTTAGNFLVARTAQETFTAMTAICTHEACTVERYESGTFTCPCHGSQYSTSGAVLRGPATGSLRRFNTTFADTVLTISLA